MKNEQKKPFSKDEILEQSNQGRDFFKLIFEATGQKLKGGNTGQLKNPFYEDSKNSVSVFKSGNVWMFKDHGNPDLYTGDVFTFAGFYYSLNPQLDFPRILELMAKELNIAYRPEFNHSHSEPIHNVNRNEVETHSCENQNQFSHSDELAFDYWLQFAPKEAMLETLSRFKVSHPKYFEFNGKRIKNDLENPSFLIQVLPNIQGFKVYRPKDKMKHFWINKPKEFQNIYGLETIPKNGQLLLIVEGVKDAITATANGFISIALDNAQTTIPRDVANELKGRFGKVILCLDNDSSGIKAMKREHQSNGLPYLILPNFINRKEFKGKDLSDYFFEGFTKDELNQILNSSLIESRNIEPSIPKTGEGFKSVPKFPIEIFPKEISDFIKESKNTLGHIEDFLSAGILFSFSVASGNKFSIHVKKTWIETSNLYMAIIGRSGIGKSSPLKLATSPLIARDKENWNTYLKERKEFQEWEKLNQSEKQNSKEVPRPSLKKFFVSDVTPEKLCTVLEQNPNGLGYFSDEFAAWFKNFGRYSKGGSESEFWLKTWSKDAIIIDRKSSDSIRIENPFISVCGGIQPGIISQLSNEGRNQNGFMERILYFWPDNIQKKPWPKEDLKDEILSNYKRAVQKITNHSGAEFYFSMEALTLLYEWQALNVEKCNSNEDEELLGYYAKFETYLIRFSLLIHLMEWSIGGESKPKESISPQIIRSSIKLIEYFQATAQKVLKYVSGNHTMNNLPERKRMFYESLPLEFKRKEILELAETFQIKIRTLDRFLSDTNYFILIETGCYKRKLQ